MHNMVSIIDVATFLAEATLGVAALGVATCVGVMHVRGILRRHEGYAQ